MKKFVTFLAGIMLLSTALVGCATTKDSSKAESSPASSGTPASNSGQVTRIGLQAPMTGDNGQYGTQMKLGVELAIKMINSNGGVNGKKFELVVGDDKATPSEAVAVVNKMVTRDQVKAVIGGFNSSPTLATQEVTGAAKIPHLHLGASPDLAKKGNKYLFRAVLNDNVYVPAVMKYMAEKQKTKKIAALYENTDYGKTMSDAAKKLSASLGVEFVSVDPYNPGDKNFSAQLTKIKSLNPDAILVAGLYNEAALISQQAKQAGLNVKMFTPSDGVDSTQLITIGGKDVEGYIFATMLDLNSESKEIAEFKKLSAENKLTPETFMAITYDATMVLAKAFEIGKDDPEKVRQALVDMKYPGVSGVVSFDEIGDRTNPSNTVPIMNVQNGKFERVKDAN